MYITQSAIGKKSLKRIKQNVEKISKNGSNDPQRFFEKSTSIKNLGQDENMLKSFSENLSVSWSQLELFAMGSMAVIPAGFCCCLKRLRSMWITDEGDANPGDGTCETADAAYYRAALEEANANVGASTVEFNI